MLADSIGELEISVVTGATLQRFTVSGKCGEAIDVRIDLSALSCRN
jgi:hypothetical protein